MQNNEADGDDVCSACVKKSLWYIMIWNSTHIEHTSFFLICICNIHYCEGKYAFIGGFDGTSNVLCGKLTGIDVRGTHAHAYIMCYSALSELHSTTISTHLRSLLRGNAFMCNWFFFFSISNLRSFLCSCLFSCTCWRLYTTVSSTTPSVPVEFVSLVLEKRKLLGYTATNEGELAAFISYAQAFPSGLMALVDTYDTVQR